MSKIQLKYGSLILLTCKTANIFCGGSVKNKNEDALFKSKVEKTNDFNDDNKSNIDIFQDKNLELNDIESGIFVKKKYVDFDDETINKLTPGYLYELKITKNNRFKYGEWNDYYYINENLDEYKFACIITKIKNNDSGLKMIPLFVKDNNVFLANKIEREGFDFNKDICLGKQCGWIEGDVFYIGIKDAPNIFPLTKDENNIKYDGLQINLENKKEVEFANIKNIKDSELFKISIETIKNNNLLNWSASFKCHKIYRDSKNKIIEDYKNIHILEVFDRNKVEDFYCLRKGNRLIFFYKNIKNNKICLLKIWDLTSPGLFNFADTIAFSEIKNGKCKLLLNENDLINKNNTQIISAIKLEDAKSVKGILLIGKIADVEQYK